MLQLARYTRDGRSSHREQTADSAADVLLGSVVRVRRIVIRPKAV